MSAERPCAAMQASISYFVEDDFLPIGFRIAILPCCGFYRLFIWQLVFFIDLERYCLTWRHLRLVWLICQVHFDFVSILNPNLKFKKGIIGIAGHPECLLLD